MENLGSGEKVEHPKVVNDNTNKIKIPQEPKEGALFVYKNGQFIQLPSNNEDYRIQQQ